jgi:hypothetical protein
MRDFGVGRVAWVVLLLAAACDLTVPWASGSEPDAPSGFAAAASPGDFDAVVLSWSPQGGVDGFELHGRIGGGPWEPLGAPIPANAVGGTLVVDPSVRELTRFTFRLRARAGSRTSAWAETAFLRGVRPPSNVTADVATQGGWRTGPVTVTWTNVSQVASDVRVERARYDAPETWKPVALATLLASAYVDHLVEDAARYRYRVRAGTADLWSEARSTGWAGAIDLAAPWGLEAEVVTSGVQLTWTNQSTTATSASVHAWLVDPWDRRTVAVHGVPSSALDATEPVWPAAQYQVEIRRDLARARSNVAPVPPFTLDGPPALAASRVLLPAIGWITRDAAGGFHVLASDASGTRIHRALAGGGHEIHAITDGSSPVSPKIVSDASGHPHTVLERYVAYGVVDVVHERWTGATWDADVVLTGASVSSDPLFALGSDGSLHLLYEPSVAPLVHALRAGGVTTTTEVPTTSMPGFSSSVAALGVGADGTAYVAQIGFGASSGTTPALVVSSRAPDGTWSDETLAVGANLSCLALAPGTGGDLALAFCRDDVTYEDDVLVVERRQGAWTLPEAVVTQPSSGYGFDLVFAGAPDLSTLVLSIGSNGLPSALHVRSDAGWKHVTVGPTSARPFVGAGASGAWALFRHADYASSTAPVPYPYSLFAEIR